MHRGRPFAEALATIQQRYQEKGVTVFDRRDETQRRHSIRRVVEVSLEFLDDEDERRHYRELGIFPEDADIPLTTTAALWGLDDLDAEALAERLADLSLLKLDLKAGTVRLHDVLQRYLLEEVESQGDPSRLHERLIAGWGDPYTLPDPYAAPPGGPPPRRRPPGPAPRPAARLPLAAGQAPGHRSHRPAG